MNMSVNNFIWEDSFPSVYGHTSISFLKRTPGYERAIKGDMESALLVVEVCAKKKLISEINIKYPHAIVVPVISDNKLPEALAKTLGLEIHTDVYKLETRSRKTLTGAERLLHRPRFAGDIIKGKSYILADDVVTQGGTVSALRRYILALGGQVVAVVALAYSTGSKLIAPSKQDIIAVTNRFNAVSITNILRNYGIADDLRELTRSQLRYLLRFNNIDGLANTLAKYA